MINEMKLIAQDSYGSKLDSAQLSEMEVKLKQVTLKYGYEYDIALPVTHVLSLYNMAYSNSFTITDEEIEAREAAAYDEGKEEADERLSWAKACASDILDKVNLEHASKKLEELAEALPKEVDVNALFDLARDIDEMDRELVLNLREIKDA